jgi:hypothetical protein
MPKKRIRPPLRTPDALDLTQLGSGERFELLCSELLQSLGYQIIRPPSRGPDRGADMIATSSSTDELGFKFDVRIAVECKHFAASGRSVTEAAVGNIIERTLSHNCDRYLLITSTIPSSTLAHQIEGINNNPSIPIKVTVWNGADIQRLIQPYPSLVRRYSLESLATSTRQVDRAKVQFEASNSQVVAIHLHPDFQDELLELIDIWNNSQTVVKFVAVRPPRELEARLLRHAPLSIDDADDLAISLRTQSGFEPNDGIVQFCEGRLHGLDAYQLFSIAHRSIDLERMAQSTISLRMMRILATKRGVSHAPVFGMIVRQILSVLGSGSRLEAHQVTRGCIMDYCNEMRDINLGLRNGPQFCPHCERLLAAIGHSHLAGLAMSAKRLLSQRKDELIGKRMQLRDDRAQAKGGKSYDVALSFAGEDRSKARALASVLTTKGISVFYDDFEKSRLWGEDLYSYLSDLYRFRATYCVMFLSRHYADKMWTNHERKAAQERAFQDNRTYILPIRIDDTEIPGILSTVGYLRWDDEDAAAIAGMIAAKLRPHHSN